MKDNLFDEKDDEPEFFNHMPGKKNNLKEERILKRDKLRKEYVSNNRVFIVDRKIYDKKLEKAEEDADNISSRRSDKNLQLIKEYECLCYGKKLVKFPKNCIAALESLKSKFPHAEHVLNDIKAQIHLQSFSKRPYAKIPNIALLGPPGSGKTTLAKNIVKTIAPEYFYLNLSIASEAFYLCGLTLSYDSGTSGEIAKILKSKFVNVFIIVEEIDKAVSINNQHRTPPAVALLELLEKSSASKFRDDALELEMDTSFLNYLFTGNEIDNIPQPLLSRMNVYHINQPNKTQVINSICDSIWTDIRSEENWGHAFSQELSLELKEKLSKFPPRKIKSYLKQAASHAAQRHEISTKKIILQENDLKIIEEKRIQMGFI